MKKGIILIITIIFSINLFAQPGINLPPVNPGGFLIIPPENIPPSMPRNRVGMFLLQLKSVQVNTTITEQAATTTIDQVFYNPTNHQLQGFYFFPIPKNASIDFFSMTINGVETPGEILDASKAKKIYEDIVRKSLDPALLEYYNQGLFKVRIFPIQPRTEKRVKLTYSQTLEKENGTIAYQFPIGSRQSEQQQVPEVSFKIDINAQGKIKNLYSPTHEVEINRKGDDKATIGFEGKAININPTFQLYYNTDDSKFGVSMLTYNERKEDGYFFLNVSPGISKPNEVINKDITFVLDASGSMAGKKMEQAQEALKFCIANLNKNDRFNIVRFSTEASTLFDEVQTANKTNREEANKFIEDLRAIGGTNIEEALEMALKSKTKNDNRPYFVVFLTDGKPTIGETQEEALLKKVKDVNTTNTRIFTFGIGTELNTHLLDKITDMTNAYRTYVLPDEDIEIKVSDFYTKVASPILTDLEIDFERSIGVTQVQPKKLPDLFMGSTLTLLGRFKKEGKSKITLKGKVNGKIQSFTYDVNFDRKADKNEFVASLWASRTVGYLLDQIRLHGESEEVKTEIVRLSKKHGIITPYTSYLILEDEALSLQTRRIAPQDQLIRSRVEEDTEFIEERVVEFNGMQKSAGRPSVEASKEAQTYNQATNLSEVQVKKSRLDYTTDEGSTVNLADDIQNIQGRAFYNNNNIWIDSNLQLAAKDIKVNKIAFNSKAYFDLVKKEPTAVEFLSLGKNVRFMLNNQVYEIYEN